MKYAIEIASGGIHTKFHDDQIRHSCNIKVITSTI
jgi:hypothetical protein